MTAARTLNLNAIQIILLLIPYISSDRQDNKYRQRGQEELNLLQVKSINMAKKDSEIMIPDEVIMNKIYLIRGKKV